MASEDDTEPGNTIGPARPSDDGQRNSEQPHSESVDGSTKDAQVPPTTQHGCSGEEKKHRIDYAIFWAALVAAIASSAAAGFTGWQAWIAKDTAKRQLRAYIVVSSKELQQFGVGQIAHVQSIVENAGQTPAHDAGWNSGIMVLDYRAKPIFTYDDCSVTRKAPEYPQWFLGKVSYPDKDRPTAFTADEFTHIQEGKAAVYFHGRLCYLDIFEEDRHTDFCVYWKWENGRLGPGTFCPNGNHAT